MSKSAAKVSPSAQITAASALTQKDADKFKRDAQKFAASATTSKEKARQTLRSLGIYTSAGKLTKKYGG